MGSEPSAPDDERALPPEEMLRLLERQSAEATRKLAGDPLGYYGPWGVAWLVGFGALFLHYGLAGEPYLPIPIGVALAVHFTSVIIASALTVYASVRSGLHVRGGSQERGMMYSFSWAVGFLSMGVIGSLLTEYGSFAPEKIGLLWASLSMMLVGVLLMAGGAVFREWPMFFIGVTLSMLNVIGTAAGPGWHALLMSLGGGGVFLVAGVVLRRHHKRSHA